MEKQTIEYWKRELLPRPKSPTGRWAPQEELNYSKDWLFNSAKQLFKWAVGEEMTKDEFVSALEQAAVHYIR